LRPDSLGADNLIIITIIANKLSGAERTKAIRTGLVLAMLFRIVLLGMVSVILTYATTVFWEFDSASVPGLALSGAMNGKAIAVIVGMNLLFSVDSILTVVGMTDVFAIMVGSVVISAALMLAFACAISDFLQGNPEFEILGLFVLLLIGFVLILEGPHGSADGEWVGVSLYPAVDRDLHAAADVRRRSVSELVGENPQRADSAGAPTSPHRRADRRGDRLSQNQQKPIDREPHEGQQHDEERDLFHRIRSPNDPPPDGVEDADWSPRLKTDWRAGLGDLSGRPWPRRGSGHLDPGARIPNGYDLLEGAVSDVRPPVTLRLSTRV
jgi:hypothetical protein